MRRGSGSCGVNRGGCELFQTGGTVAASSGSSADYPLKGLPHVRNPVEAPPSPLKFDPGFEQPELDEAATADALVTTFRQISETTYADSGTPLRGVHAKGHAILKAELTVADGLPPVLAQGLFARPGRYPAIIRISTIPGDILHDSIAVPRGFALKVAGVEGERLPGSEDEREQDFVLAAGKSFVAPDGRSFLKNLQFLAATTDRPQVLKKVLSATLRKAEAVVEAFGGESGTLKRLGGQPLTNPLAEAYFSQAPILYGDYMAKIGVFPVSPELIAMKDEVLDASGRPDLLREEMSRFFTARSAAWELRVQLCTDLASMPIEDSSIPWPEEESPYIAVARLIAPAQPSWDEAHKDGLDAQLAFSPWRGLAAHRPLGSVMRLRRPAYRMSARFREERRAGWRMAPAAWGDTVADANRQPILVKED